MKCASTFIFDMIKYRLMCIYGNLIEKKSKGVGQWVGGGGGGGGGGERKNGSTNYNPSFLIPRRGWIKNKSGTMKNGAHTCSLYFYFSVRVCDTKTKL